MSSWASLLFHDTYFTEVWLWFMQLFIGTFLIGMMEVYIIGKHSFQILLGQLVLHRLWYYCYVCVSAVIWTLPCKAVYKCWLTQTGKQPAHTAIFSGYLPSSCGMIDLLHDMFLQIHIPMLFLELEINSQDVFILSYKIHVHWIHCVYLSTNPIHFVQLYHPIYMIMKDALPFYSNWL